MKFANTRVYNFQNSLYGMRNPKNSWNLSDSQYGICKYEEVPENSVIVTYYSTDLSDKPTARKEETERWNGKINCVEYAKIGSNDMKLATTLIRSGTCHSKFMRQIFVSVDITAPQFIWSELDTYKVATTTNSTSKIHKLVKSEITKDCFEMDDYENVDKNNEDWDETIQRCEYLRQKFNETGEKKYWKELIRILPESWLQTRTFTCDYETLKGICSSDQRRNHKLNEWSGLDKPEVKEYFIKWARSLPYAQELIFFDEYLGIKRITLDNRQIEYLTSKGIDIMNLNKQIKDEGWEPSVK